jgi:hypothetical protein
VLSAAELENLKREVWQELDAENSQEKKEEEQ